jgi:hypothetical protein
MLTTWGVRCPSVAGPRPTGASLSGYSRRNKNACGLLQAVRKVLDDFHETRELIVHYRRRVTKGYVGAVKPVDLALGALRPIDLSLLDRYATAVCQGAVMLHAATSA